MDETIPQAAAPASAAVGAHHKRDILGTLIGLLVFFCGIGLLLVTFNLAYSLFTIPPDSVLGLQHGKGPLDVAKASDSAALLIFKIFLLLIMACVGSIVANRGISLYSGARGLHK